VAGDPARYLVQKFKILRPLPFDVGAVVPGRLVIVGKTLGAPIGKVVKPLPVKLPARLRGEAPADQGGALSRED
jgi:hypothetical protein